MMTLDDRLKFCRICQNRKINPAIGLVCQLTEAKPAFEERCSHFIVDEPEANRLMQLEKAAREEEDYSGHFSLESRGVKKGVVGGVIMIAIALVWFFGGLAAGYIFFYPPILLAIGLFALIKGIAKGNFNGSGNRQK